jgi:hypothetical protein
MLRSMTCRIVALILMAAAAWSESMTQEQAEAWVKEQIAQGANGVTTIARKISALDFILQGTVANGAVTAYLPQRLIVVDGEDLVLSYQPAYIELIVARPNASPYLVYRISMPAERVEKLVPRGSPWPELCGLLAAALVSTVTMDAVPPITGAPLAREGISFGAGSLAGLAVWWLWPR